MRKIGIVLLIIVSLCGCSIKGKTASQDELTDILASGNYVVVDVRTEEEFVNGHVEGALNIPYDEIDENVDLDKKRPILVYCQSGSRSKKAYERLVSLGFKVLDLGAYNDVPLVKVN